MSEILSKSIQSVQESDAALCKYITANDIGSTGGHQFGFHLPKNAWSVFFDRAGVKGENRERFATIRWQDDFETSSRFIYYGVGTRNEYRVTRFGKGFPYLSEERLGDLLIIARRHKEFSAWVLSADEDIDGFFAAFNLVPTAVPGLVEQKTEEDPEAEIVRCFAEFLSNLKIEFPPGIDIALRARKCFNQANGVDNNDVRNSPDSILLKWIETEYRLFKVIEADRYADRIAVPFANVEELIETANTILNRRKSRAGKSLEYHLAEIFRINRLEFSVNARTEGNKRPDFIFPGEAQYHDAQFDPAKLVVLGCKTTCKDRWRQVLNEADRIPTKHLFTLQQGISTNQLREMKAGKLSLVVPKSHVNSFPKEFRPELLTIESFVNRIAEL